MLKDFIEKHIRNHIDIYYGSLIEIDYDNNMILYKNDRGLASILSLSKIYEEVIV